ncbi:type VI secretion system tip protein VgrG [Mangrovibacter sp. SLW1]
MVGHAFFENRCWRPAARPRPVVSGTLMARVTSAKPDDIYAWQDTSGLYRVKFDADRDDKRKGMESMPVRLAKPYGGHKYGFHFPLVQGTEVAIAFHEGDPDRPYIAHALHDSRHIDPVTELNSTRNVVRTAGRNKLRMEDKRGAEHVKLSTEYGGKTQLNLGHNVNAERKLRGEGAELRTDRHVAIRGGAGVFITADKQPKAQGDMLDMNAAVAQLQNALQLVTALAQSAGTSGALDADITAQQHLAQVLNQLKEAGLLLSAPAGVAAVTPESIQLSAGKTLTATAGENADVTVFKRFTVAAGEAISLFAHKLGLKIFAARGRVDIQAQSGAMQLQSDQQMSINSAKGEIVLNAAQGITLTSTGGAYIKIKDGAVEIGAPGKISLNSTMLDWGGPASLERALMPAVAADPQYQFPVSGGFQVVDRITRQPKAWVAYRIETPEGKVLRGRTDENGCTKQHYGIDPKNIKLFFE